MQIKISCSLSIKWLELIKIYLSEFEFSFTNNSKIGETYEESNKRLIIILLANCA